MMHFWFFRHSVWVLSHSSPEKCMSSPFQWFHALFWDSLHLVWLGLRLLLWPAGWMGGSSDSHAHTQSWAGTSPRRCTWVKSGQKAVLHRKIKVLPQSDGGSKNKRCLLQMSSSEKRKKWDYFSSGYLLWIINTSFSTWLINTYPSGTGRSISSVKPFLRPSDRTGNCLHRPPAPAITWRFAAAKIAINLYTALSMYVPQLQAVWPI